MIYAKFEPFGSREDYRRSGIVASMIGNTHLRRGARPFKPEDFMPVEPKIQRPQTVEEMATVLKRTFRWAQRKGLTKENQRG